MEEKCFGIQLVTDNKYVQFRCKDLMELGIFPAISLTKGEDPMEMESNVPAIVNQIKQMMIKEGYNLVVCEGNNLAIYCELIAELKHIPGLEVRVI